MKTTYAAQTYDPDQHHPRIFKGVTIAALFFGLLFWGLSFSTYMTKTMTNGARGFHATHVLSDEFIDYALRLSVFYIVPPLFYVSFVLLVGKFAVRLYQRWKPETYEVTRATQLKNDGDGLALWVNGRFQTYVLLPQVMTLENATGLASAAGFWENNKHLLQEIESLVAEQAQLQKSHVESLGYPNHAKATVRIAENRENLNQANRRFVTNFYHAVSSQIPPLGPGITVAPAAENQGGNLSFMEKLTRTLTTLVFSVAIATVLYLLPPIQGISGGVSGALIILLFTAVTYLIFWQGYKRWRKKKNRQPQHIALLLHSLAHNEKGRRIIKFEWEQTPGETTSDECEISVIENNRETIASYTLTMSVSMLPRYATEQAAALRQTEDDALIGFAATPTEEGAQKVLELFELEDLQQARRLGIK